MYFISLRLFFKHGTGSFSLAAKVKAKRLRPSLSVYRLPFAIDAFVGHLNESRCAVALPDGQDIGVPQRLVS